MASYSKALDSDIHIASFAFIVTGLLYRFTHEQLERRLPKWDQFSRAVRDRIAVEIACIPVRLGLIYFTLPTVVTVFSPASAWTALDTQRTLIACSLMTGAYGFDLIIYREDILSVLHHCMGPALLFWTRTCFSSFSSADALVSRSLMMFVFFGAATGGIAATAGVFLLRVGKTYLRRATLYRYFSLCVASLTVATILSCYMNVLYFLQVWEEAFSYFGWFAPVPVIWETFECYLQWRWLLRFYELEAKLRQPKDGKGKRSASPDSDDQIVQADASSTEHIPSMFPRWTVPLVKLLVWQWIALCAALWYKLGQDSYLSLSKMENSMGFQSSAMDEFALNITGDMCMAF
ncbi:hypothetical protein B0T19DRAFT_441444 [Cercophora scortea]|uniref:Uncharacterized protein n=1 Tax=Cercophora scortea TaxID=314031 RepID=A0AAE0IM53_9PEZI|nr:hypothetical protein B0T19DRAFT_441444 [Cercophora scortea]